MPPEETSIYDGIEAIGEETPVASPEPSPAPAPEPKAVETPATPTPAPAPAPKLPFDDDIPQKPKPQAQDKPKPEATKPEPKIPENQKSVRGGSLEEFRKNYETTKKERDELASKLKALETAREEGTRAEIKKATEAYEKKVSELEAKYTEVETRLRFTDYTRSSEYKEKFEKPLESAWREAISDISGATIELEDGTERQASVQDIQSLLHMPAIAAARRANELFGAAAPAVLQHRNAILSLTRARESAIKEYQEKGAEREREMQTNSERQRERIYGVFNETIKHYETADASLYGRPEDPEEQKYWDKGDRLIALAVKRQGLDESLPEDEQSAILTKAQATVAARARAFGPLIARMHKLEAEVESLRGKQAKLTKSEPGNGSDRKAEARESGDLYSGIDSL